MSHGHALSFKKGVTFAGFTAAKHLNCGRVQDPYTMRCVPQVHGITNDTIQFVKGIITTEMNSALDNPVRTGGMWGMREMGCWEGCNLFLVALDGVGFTQRNHIRRKLPWGVSSQGMGSWGQRVCVCGHVLRLNCCVLL